MMPRRAVQRLLAGHVGVDVAQQQPRDRLHFLRRRVITAVRLPARRPKPSDRRVLHRVGPRKAPGPGHVCVESVLAMPAGAGIERDQQERRVAPDGFVLALGEIAPRESQRDADVRRVPSAASKVTLEPARADRDTASAAAANPSGAGPIVTTTAGSGPPAGTCPCGPVAQAAIKHTSAASSPLPAVGNQVIRDFPSV